MSVKDVNNPPDGAVIRTGWYWCKENIQLSLSNAASELRKKNEKRYENLTAGSLKSSTMKGQGKAAFTKRTRQAVRTLHEFLVKSPEFIDVRFEGNLIKGKDKEKPHFQNERDKRFARRMSSSQNLQNLLMFALKEIWFWTPIRTCRRNSYAQ